MDIGLCNLSNLILKILPFISNLKDIMVSQEKLDLENQEFYQQLLDKYLIIQVPY